MAAQTPDTKTQVTPKRRRPGSFVRKITTGQAFRLIRILFWLDVFIVILFLGLQLGELEAVVREVGELPADSLEQRLDTIPGASTQVVEEWLVRGIALDDRLERRLGIRDDAVRHISFQSAPENPFFQDIPYRPVYTVALPAGEGTYTALHFDFGAAAGRFCSGMGLLLLVQVVIFIAHVKGTRKAARKTLAPIEQLAMATQSISAERVPRVQRQPKEEPESPAAQKAKGRGHDKRKKEQRDLQREEKRRQKQEELALSGTIKTLNQITVGRLDTRIPIEGERRELQGLAVSINNMLDRLDAAYSSQLRFVSDASHELRTPIAVLQGYANLLDRWGKDDPAVLQESIDAIKAEAEGMQVLVEQLLFLARSDNNSIVMQMQPLEASAVATEVLRETQMVDKRHVLISDIDGDLFTEGDTGLLKQALRIFVDNAVKYTPEGGQIRIGAKQWDGELRISVTDNGIGIPDEELPHVFERFYRADESRARATGGTGLGLSIAQWIVQRHGGHMEIISRQDVGTRLTMVLPVYEAAAEGEDEGEAVS